MSIYVNPKLKANFGFVESSLEGREWFCGTGGGVTGADGQSSFLDFFMSSDHYAR